MKLTRFRRPAAAPKNSARPSPKPKLRFLAGAMASLMLGLAASLYVFFPTSALEERIEYEINGRTPVKADLKGLSLGFPPALRANTLTLEIEKPQPLALSFDAPSVKPLWLSFFGGNPGVAVQGGILGGEGEGTVRRDGTMEVRLAKILFDTPLPSLTSLRVSGALSKARIDRAAPLKPTTESHLELQLENVAITGLKSVGIGGDSLSIGTLSLKGEGKGNAFRIEQLDTRGGDVKVSGSGTVLLGRTVESSRLNLTVALSPEQTLDKGIADLLALLRPPGRDGSYRFKVTGTLANPVVK